MFGIDKQVLKTTNPSLFLLLSFFQNCWFTEAIWFFYWGKFVNKTLIRFSPDNVKAFILVLGHILSLIVLDKHLSSSLH